MSEIDWAEETRKRSAKAKKAFEKYQADKTKKLLKDWTDNSPHRTATRFITYLDSRTTTATHVITKTTDFQIDPDRTMRVFKSTSKEQLFLAVGGPLAGKRFTRDEAPDYVSYNYAGLAHDSGYPSAILVYKQALKE